MNQGDRSAGDITLREVALLVAALGVTMLGLTVRHAVRPALFGDVLSVLGLLGCVAGNIWVARRRRQRARSSK